MQAAARAPAAPPQPGPTPRGCCCCSPPRPPPHPPCPPRPPPVVVAAAAGRPSCARRAPAFMQRTCGARRRSHVCIKERPPPRRWTPRRHNYALAAGSASPLPAAQLLTCRPGADAAAGRSTAWWPTALSCSIPAACPVQQQRPTCRAGNDSRCPAWPHTQRCNPARGQVCSKRLLFSLQVDDALYQALLLINKQNNRAAVLITHRRWQPFSNRQGFRGREWS